MLFSKSPKMSYVDMCIFFDKNFYEKDRDEEKCYKYMYLIYHMLACKKKYFVKFEDYDKFAQFAANTIYLRFLKKQKEGERIKSILNYAKSTLYPLKVMYQNAEYREIMDNEKTPDIDIEPIKNDLKNSVRAQYHSEIESGMEDAFQLIPLFIKEELDKTPYKSNYIEKKRLYVSCLISLLKSFTMSNYHKERFLNQEEKMSEEKLVAIYNRERTSSPTLWRLEDSLLDYVTVITNKVRKRMADEILDTLGSYELRDEVLEDILSSAWEESTHENAIQEEVNNYQ